MREEENIYPDFGSGPRPPLLGDEDLKKLLMDELAGWKLIETPLPDNLYKDRKELYKQFSFDSFDSVLKFLNELKPVCDMIPHHPRFENVYATLEIYLSTWAHDYEISFKDVILAQNIDRLYEANYLVDPQITNSEVRENVKFFEALKEEISRDDLYAAIARLNSFYDLNPSKERPNELVTLMGDHTGYMKAYVAGGVSKEESDRKRNQLSQRFLTLIDQLKQ